jgi:5'-deoxynucleotidase YfbR-like HD superfamily hydrolase
MFDKYKLNDIKDVLDFARQNNRMSYLERYNTTPHLFKESVADHSFQVSIVSLFLYEKYKDKLKLNFESLIKMAIIHDEAESVDYIGDVPHPIKENNPILKQELENYEYKAIKELLGIEYVKYLKEFNEEKSNESLIVKLADVISCLIYSESEINKGNKYMERVKFESEEIIIKCVEKIKDAIK